MKWFTQLFEKSEQEKLAQEFDALLRQYQRQLKSKQNDDRVLVGFQLDNVITRMSKGQKEQAEIKIAEMFHQFARTRLSKSPKNPYDAFSNFSFLFNYETLLYKQAYVELAKNIAFKATTEIIQQSKSKVKNALNRLIAIYQQGLACLPQLEPEAKRLCQEKIASYKSALAKNQFEKEERHSLDFLLYQQKVIVEQMRADYIADGTIDPRRFFDHLNCLKACYQGLSKEIEQEKINQILKITPRALKNKLDELSAALQKMAYAAPSAEKHAASYMRAARLYDELGVFNEKEKLLNLAKNVLLQSHSQTSGTYIKQQSVPILKRSSQNLHNEKLGKYQQLCKNDEMLNQLFKKAEKKILTLHRFSWWRTEQKQHAVRSALNKVYQRTMLLLKVAVDAGDEQARDIMTENPDKAYKLACQAWLQNKDKKQFNAFFKVLNAMPCQKVAAIPNKEIATQVSIVELMHSAYAHKESLKKSKEISRSVATWHENNEITECPMRYSSPF